jgi:hypothetical protein
MASDKVAEIPRPASMDCGGKRSATPLSLPVKSAWCNPCVTSTQSGVALRLPPQSKPTPRALTALHRSRRTLRHRPPLCSHPPVPGRPRLRRQLMSHPPAKPINRPPRPPRLSSAATVTPSLCPNRPLAPPETRDRLTPGPHPPQAHPQTRTEFHPNRRFPCGRLHLSLLLLL